MNDNRKFEAKKEWLLLLLDLKMPHEIIEKMLDISTSTVIKYQKILKGENLIKQKISQYADGEKIILKLYADLKTSTASFGLPLDFLNKLLTALAEFLNEEEILRVMKLSLPAILSFQERRYDESVPTGYQELMNDVFGVYLGRHQNFFNDSDSYAEREWQKYLENISTRKIPVPENVRFDWRKNHFVRDILKNIADDNRKYYVSIITHDVCRLFDDLINTLADYKKRLIIDHYGLDENNPTGKRTSLAEIAQASNIGTERARQIKEKSLKYLFNNLKRGNIENPTWESILALRKKCDERIEEIKKSEEKNYLSLLLKDDEIKEASFMDSGESKVLLLQVDDLTFSARVINCLRSMDVKFIYQLVQANETELLKIRNLGKTTIKEINQVLNSWNLQLGTIFSEKRKLYFEFMTREDK